jgi:osmotically-inducible protein OsmY
VKSRFFEDKDVAGSSISVETLNGTVMLSGFAKSTLERNKAETIARSVRGVTSVRNEVAVRP